MATEILAFWIPGPIELIIVFIFLGVPVLLIVLFVRYLLRNKRENVRLRLEVGKLADELEQMRKQRESDARNNS